MPALISEPPYNGITKFTNCRLVKGDKFVNQDLWVSSTTGKIIHSQASFYDQFVVPDEVVNLGGRIISPGLIECQLNGAYGFNFSTLLDDMSQYGKKIKALNRKLIQTGVTSYIPTITSQKSEVYKKVCLHRRICRLDVFVLLTCRRPCRTSGRLAILIRPWMARNLSGPTSKGRFSTRPRTAFITLTSSAEP
jgi:hypothetical protein